MTKPILTDEEVMAVFGGQEAWAALRDELVELINGKRIPRRDVVAEAYARYAQIYKRRRPRE